MKETSKITFEFKGEVAEKLMEVLNVKNGAKLDANWDHFYSGYVGFGPNSESKDRKTTFRFPICVASVTKEDQNNDD